MSQDKLNFLINFYCYVNVISKYYFHKYTISQCLTYLINKFFPFRNEIQRIF